MRSPAFGMRLYQAYGVPSKKDDVNERLEPVHSKKITKHMSLPRRAVAQFRAGTEVSSTHLKFRI